jgi:hypothetical protein
MHQIIKQLHDTYINITGIQVTEMLHQNKWYLFCQAGFKEQDLKDVLAWIKRENSRNRYQYSVRLSTLIGDLEHFDELRGLAHRRKPPVRSEGQKTLDSFRGYEQEPPTSKTISIGDILRRASNGG